jgi:hypothetical protein
MSSPIGTPPSPERIAELMIAKGYFVAEADVIPEAAWRWIDMLLVAYGERIATPHDALPFIAALRAESVVVPALELERLRSRAVLFFLDSVSQYVDHAPELRDLPLQHDLIEIAREFGLAPEDALWSVRMALTGRHDGPPLELLFPLLGHDRMLIRIGAISSRLLHGRGLEPIPFGPDGKPFAPIQGHKPADGS